MTKTQKFLLEILQYKHLNRIDISTYNWHEMKWSEIIGYSMLHRVAGMVFYSLNELSLQENIPREMMSSLSKVHESQFLRKQSLNAYLFDISDKLISKNIPHVFLKGSILSNTIYTSGVRSSNDIDILIHSKYISQVEDCLIRLGYFQGVYDKKKKEIVLFNRAEILKRRLNWGETAPFVQMANQPGLEFVEIDINFSLDWLPGKNQILIERMLERSIQVKVDEHVLTSLCREDFLFQLCIHLHKEYVLKEMVNRSKDINLYKLLDIYAYLSEYDILWDHFLTLCENDDLAEACYLALELTCRLFPVLRENKQLNKVLSELMPAKEDYFNIVIDPSTQKEYCWEIPFLERVFDENRRFKLLER